MNRDSKFSELVVFPGTGLAVHMDVTCIPCKEEDGGKQRKDWMTPQLWKEALALLSPLVEDKLATDEATAGKKATEEAVVMQGDNVRLACAFRKCSHSSLRLAHPDASRLFSMKLCVGAALRTDSDGPATVEQIEGDRLAHKAIGAPFQSENISQYFGRS